MLQHRLARASAEVAPLRPRFPAPAAMRTRDANGNAERDDEAVERLTLRERHLGAQDVGVHTIPQKGVTHTFDDASHRRKVDCDLVCKTLVRHQSPANDRSRSQACQGDFPVLGSLLSLLGRTRIMPASMECPLCGGSMKRRETKNVTRVPGNPSATTRITWEWVSLTATTLKKPKRKAADERPD